MARDVLLLENSPGSSGNVIVCGASHEMKNAAAPLDYQSTNVVCGVPTSAAIGAPLVPPRKLVMLPSGCNRLYSNERQPTLQERLCRDSRQTVSKAPLMSNYNVREAVNAPQYLHMPFSVSNAASFAHYVPLVGSCETNDAAMVHDAVVFDENYVKLNRELKPLTRLPNALPLDIAVAAERSRRVIDTFKPEPTSIESPQAPKRPEHPSVESQLVC